MKLTSNMATDYSLMVREARGAILNPGVQISEAGAEFMPPGGQGRNIEVRGAILGLNAELGRLCPFSAPRGHTRFESMSFVVNILACKLKIVNNRN